MEKLFNVMEFSNVVIVDFEHGFTLIGGLFGSEAVDQNCSFCGQLHMMLCAIWYHLYN